MSILDNGKPPRKGIKFEPQRDDPAGFELTAEERQAIREKARLTVAKELKDRAEKALFDQMLLEERGKVDPEQILQPLFLDIPPHMPYIMLDGTQYFHNRLYQVTPPLFATLTEVMARGWAHEDETEVRDTKTRRRARAPSHIGMTNFMDHRQQRDLVVSSSQLAGTSPAALLGFGA